VLAAHPIPIQRSTLSDNLLLITRVQRREEEDLLIKSVQDIDSDLQELQEQQKHTERQQYGPFDVNQGR